MSRGLAVTRTRLFGLGFGLSGIPGQLLYGHLKSVQGHSLILAIELKYERLRNLILIPSTP